MKKIVKIVSIVIIVILLVLIISPFLFKGKIIEIVKNEVNKTMNAKIDFDHLGLNFFKSFPNASVSLDNFCITGTEEFEGDTLFFAENLAATVNLKSLFGNSGYEITKVSVSNAKLHAIVLEDGKANWDIMPESGSAAEEESTDFKLSLKNVSVSNSDILYDDFTSKMNAILNGVNLNLSGDMTADETTLKTNFTVDALGFIMDKIPYLSKANAKAEMNILADLKNMKFTLADNHIQLNDIKANLDGWIIMHEDESMEMDIHLNAPTTQFKDILSMIPAIYAKDFKDLKTSGEATLEASAKGTMKDELLPAFDAKLNVANAMFQYPGMPKSVTNINTNIHAYSNGGTMDNTIVDISRFHFEMGENPFDFKLLLKTPMSDPNINMSAVGKLNLGMIEEIYPLEDMKLSGVLNANMSLATLMSYIEKEQYEKVEASGTLTVNDMMIDSEKMDQIKVQNAALTFSPRYVDLSGLSVMIGKNDIAASGKLENFIPYFMKNETLKGNLSVTSNYLNLNDFMSKEEETASDTTSLALIEIPKNINFNLNGTFKEVIFENLTMNDVSGQINVKDGKVDMQNLAMNALGGKLKVNGYYDTGKDPKQPEASLSLDISEASFAQTFSTFVTIQKIAPIFESMLGTYSTNLQLTTPLGEGFMPILTSLDANGLLLSNNVEVKEIPILSGLASTLNNESLKQLKIKDLKLPFTIDNGRVSTKPFDINFGSGTMNLSGTTGLDQSIDYMAKVNLTDKLSNKYLQNISVKIGGTFASPKFSLDTKDVANQLLGNIAGSILGSDTTGVSLSEQIDNKKAELSEKANAEFDKQAENIRKQAKDAGDKLISEAQKQGQKLVDEANKTSNVLARAAAVKGAEVAAKKLEEEATKKAKDLNDQAEKQITGLKDKLN